MELEPNLSSYDIAHIFNLCRPQEPYLQARRAKRWGIPLVMSTIYWNMYEVNRASARYHLGKRILGRFALDEDFKSRLLGIIDNLMVRDPGYALRLQRNIGLRRQQLEILDKCRILLPNSTAEAEIIRKDFNCYKPCHIVPNAINPSIFKKRGKSLDSQRPPYILSVGNITIRKNQLSLMKAIKDLGLHLVLVGRSGDPPKSYSDECLRECKRNNFEYLGELPQEDIIPLYYGAKVHALVSWVETPGLSNLEAGLCGCNIVSTEVGGTREYFQSFAWYCDPGDINSIKDAIRRAFEAPKSSYLSKHIKKCFTWDRAAQETFNAYVQALNA